MAPHHPLRRISTGSLSSLARSQDRQHASPSGLDFLQPALTELADEAATLASNVQKLNELHDALGTFNESFAGWLWALKMNAFCVEWPLAPDENSFLRLQANKIPPPPQPPSLTPHTDLGPSSSSSTGPGANAADVPPSPPSSSAQHAGDMTYATQYTDDGAPATVKKPLVGVLKKPSVGAGAGAGAAGARKVSGALKKKRELEIAGIIDTLPLEYRGNDPAARIAMEKILGKLMARPEGLGLKEMIAPPELPQPKVNKCLIALVAKKLVTKSTVAGTAQYKWNGAV